LPNQAIVGLLRAAPVLDVAGESLLGLLSSGSVWRDYNKAIRPVHAILRHADRWPGVDRAALARSLSDKGNRPRASAYPSSSTSGDGGPTASIRGVGS